MSRAGKVTGLWQNRYSVRIDRDDDIGYEDLSIDLDAVSEFHKADEQEVVNIVMVQRSGRSKWNCLEANIIEVQKLKDFKTYTKRSMIRAKTLYLQSMGIVPER